MGVWKPQSMSYEQLQCHPGPMFMSCQASKRKLHTKCVCVAKSPKNCEWRGNCVTGQPMGQAIRGRWSGAAGRLGNLFAGHYNKSKINIQRAAATTMMRVRHTHTHTHTHFTMWQNENDFCKFLVQFLFPLFLRLISFGSAGLEIRCKMSTQNKFSIATPQKQQQQQWNTIIMGSRTKGNSEASARPFNTSRISTESTKNMN